MGIVIDWEFIYIKLDKMEEYAMPFFKAIRFVITHWIATVCIANFLRPFYHIDSYWEDGWWKMCVQNGAKWLSQVTSNVSGNTYFYRSKQHHPKKNDFHSIADGLNTWRHWRVLMCLYCVHLRKLWSRIFIVDAHHLASWWQSFQSCWASIHT